MLTIVIPTYWQRKKNQPSMPGDFVFDHPTNLDGDDTLTRTLESLSGIEGKFNVVVITAAVNHDIDSEVEARVEEIILPFRKAYPILQFAFSDLVFLRERMSSLGLLPSDISLDGYSAIRNCQLLVPAVMGADVIAAIDDDEVVEPDYAEQALTFIGGEVDGVRADGIAGRYFYEWGSYRVKESDAARKAENIFDRKHALQNDSYDLFDSRPGRVVRTSITLGGNMVFSRELFNNVPFDPRVTRGEDIDYLINSRMMGYNWMLDKELKIYHYPPPCNPSHKLQEDIIRFVYEKKKIELAGKTDGWNPVSIDELKPYPGEFFTDRVEKDALQALKSRTDLSGNESFFMDPEETMATARKRAGEAGEFFPFARRWKNTLAVLSEDSELVEYFCNKLIS